MTTFDLRVNATAWLHSPYPSIRRRLTHARYCPVGNSFGSLTNRLTSYFEDATREPEHISDAIDEWYLRAEAVDLFPDVSEEQAWNQYLAAAD